MIIINAETFMSKLTIKPILINDFRKTANWHENTPFLFNGIVPKVRLYNLVPKVLA